jgi:hypothetical protein
MREKAGYEIFAKQCGKHIAQQHTINPNYALEDFTVSIC